MLGFTLPYEQLYTNVLTTLDLAGIPLTAAERAAPPQPLPAAVGEGGWPLILAGGSACLNPEPMHAFFDAFFIGEGEEAIVEIVRVWSDARARRPEPHRSPGPPGANRGRVRAFASTR